MASAADAAPAVARPAGALPVLTAPLWLLVLVTLSGTMAMHIFVPALPVAGSALHAPAASMQQTITLYVIGLALGQLVYGPVSDTWGRRPALLVGLGLYLSASVVALCAPTLEWLLAARLVQALGGAAGITLGRAIVRDIAPPERVTKDLALLNLLTLVGPGLAPIVGSYLAEHFGWRAIYLFLVGMGVAMVLCTWRMLPETNRQRRPLAIAGIARDYRTLLCTPRFAGFMLGGACSTTALYPYLATAPYIVHGQLGYPIAMVGWFAAATIVGASLGTLVTRRLAGRYPAERFLYVGGGIGLTMAFALLVVQLAGWLNGPILVAVTLVMTLGAGMSSPAALSRGLSAVPWLTGSAAGLYGFGQMAMGALGTKLVGYGDNPVVACAVTQICIIGLALASYRFAASQPVAVQGGLPAR
ncbi:multidrug effflux MFS transporter [Comamonas terrigena]|uniref:multidrug effflux MFS transporter n=1 Tax=Comamonas terrigena TaxID=32013 RepID=UPI00244CF0E3|nr:multidrug effflux MFS transporter [Comamonas terrigena]MDH0050116.1 multidrug effflux MFS transporter [Comamonas terrigena]MDH0512320.1 multidrug effflux MFS transporter [Comamonas terrigena]MDH1091846.1 multidrug effflux MFS transporter [Comamonas terrigena]MDH1502084.1 multidrug effflux MFS transporter [Comamonas terrigena]